MVALDKFAFPFQCLSSHGLGKVSVRLGASKVQHLQGKCWGGEGEQLNSPGTPLTRLSSVTCLAVVAQVCQPHPQPGEFTEFGAHPFKPGVMPSPAWNASPLLCGNYVNLMQGVSMATANWEMRHS